MTHSPRSLLSRPGPPPSRKPTRRPLRPHIPARGSSPDTGSGPRTAALPQIMIPRKERVPQPGLFLMSRPARSRADRAQKELRRTAPPSSSRGGPSPPAVSIPEQARKTGEGQPPPSSRSCSGEAGRSSPWASRKLPSTPGARTPSAPGRFAKRRMPPLHGSCRESLWSGVWPKIFMSTDTENFDGVRPPVVGQGQPQRAAAG